MNPEFSKLKQREAEAAQSVHTAEASGQGAEFAAVDDLLRYDSEQNPVPPSVEERVKESVASEPPQPKKSWLGRFLGK